ncbi:MAG: hypothetical protein K8I30_11770, partial [Anaerolineae bacterium]|nr:hypothetical protein [Anaerolineae bacterium]
ISIAIAMTVMALLSKRLGSVMRTPRYYMLFYIAAGLMAVSALARLLNIGRGTDIVGNLGQDPVSVLLYVGLPAIAITLGLVAAWRYWSWLLAERG